MNSSDHELWQRFKRGDGPSLAELLRRYHDDLYRYGLKLANGDAEAAKDAIQEVFGELWARRENLADVLLMLAEAYVEQGQADKALPLVNQVRSRVKAFEYKSLDDQAAARALVRRERQLELTGEQRWFDLNRWGVAQQVLNAEKQLQIGKQPFQAKHVLFPIPQLEKDTNPAVASDVNSGWN